MGYSLETSGQVAGTGPKSSFSVDFSVGEDFKKEWPESQSTSIAFKITQPALPGNTTMCIGFVEY